MLRKRVDIFSGVPGSGKTYHVKEVSVYTTVVCSADHFFLNESGEYVYDQNLLSWVHQQCRKKFLDALKQGKNHVVVDNTNLEAVHVTRYINWAQEFGYAIRIFSVTCNMDDAFKRQEHGVPVQQHRLMRRKFTQIQSYFLDGHAKGLWQYIIVEN